MFRVLAAVLQAFMVSAIVNWPGHRCEAANTSDSEAAYTQDITKRADKIVAPLGLSDDAQKTRVRDLISQQYRFCREIHGARDSRISEVKKASADPSVTKGQVEGARD